METARSIKQALFTGNATLLRQLARASQTSQQEMALEFVADLIEDHYPEKRSSAA